MHHSISLTRYLDRVQGLYPYGIPESILERFHSPLQKSVTRKGLIFVVALGGELSPEVSELLDSIIAKGLLLLPGQINIVVLDAEKVNEDLIRESIEESLASGVVVPFGIFFGAGLEAPGVLKTILNSEILSTRSLIEVLASREVKREVWQHLQQVKPLAAVFQKD